MNWIVDVVRRFGSVLSTTEPAEIVPVPVFAAVADVRIGAAAAILPGSVIATLMSFTAPLVGRITKRSPATAEAFTSIDRPSATNGSAAVPVPVIVTTPPVDMFFNVHTSFGTVGGLASAAFCMT